jgi:hypothetical protein
MFLQWDAKGRITSIRDPGDTGNPTYLPSVKYEYNEDTGNLWKVHKLVDRAAGTYAITTYRCENSSFPSYITSIDDPRGAPLARTEYYDASVNSSDALANGRTKSVTDAKGRTTTFGYVQHVTGQNDNQFDDPGRATSKVTVTDQEGNVTTQELDQYGNVILTKNALGLKTTRWFQALPAEPTLPIKEQFTTQLAPGGPATMLTRKWKFEDTDYPFAPSAILNLFEGDPADDSGKPRTKIEYNRFGQTLQVTEPNSVANGSTAWRSYGYQVNDFDGTGHRQLIAETFTGSDPSANGQVLTENNYDASGRLQWSHDANNTFTVYIYIIAARLAAESAT